MTADERAKAELRALVRGLTRAELEGLAVNLAFQIALEQLDRRVAEEVRKVQAALEVQTPPSQEQIAKATAFVAFEMLDVEGEVPQ
jgi:hypothetical protein